MPLVLEPASFTRPGTTEEVAGKIATCSCRPKQDPVFHVVQIADQGHWHIECAYCRKMYCPQGACEKYLQSS